MQANIWLFYSILSILAVNSAEISFFSTPVSNKRPYKVSISCHLGLWVTLDRTRFFGSLIGDTTVIPACLSPGISVYNHLADGDEEPENPGWHYYEWRYPMALVPGYQCAILGPPDADQLRRYALSETYINCCFGPWCVPEGLPTRRQLSNLPNGEEFCESDHMIRNAHACQQSSCCHWNTWEHGEASFHGEGRCWSSIGTQTCNDVHTEVGLVECADEPAFWYDSDGPYYDCHWYRQDNRRCAWYGYGYRNFGKTANEACCGCRHVHGNGRRELEEIEGEDHVPKRGFLFTNEIASGFNVESSEMIALDGVTSTASQCQERSWWDYVSLEHPTLECSAGEAIGAFYKTSLPDLETWSVERGYCCAIDASDECTWKEVEPSAELMTCDAGYVLSGFKMDDKGFLFSDVEEIKCCKQ